MIFTLTYEKDKIILCFLMPVGLFLIVEIWYNSLIICKTSIFRVYHFWLFHSIIWIVWDSALSADGENTIFAPLKTMESSCHQWYYKLSSKADVG